jgi:hypothetical protein
MGAISVWSRAGSRGPELGDVIEREYRLKP